MNYGNYTNFWNDIQVNNTSFTDDVDTKPKVDHIALAGYRRAIGNFVNILTNRSDIPVRYQSNGDSYTDGKIVTIGSKIDEKNFDHVVGLALHEGSHVLLSDFAFLRNLEQNTPHELLQKGLDIGYDKFQVLGHLKNMLNYVEDRRIDYYVFSTSPGYKGYYHKMYDKYFHSKVIDKALRENTFGNDKTYNNYEARIINLTNKNTDLNALPKLHQIKHLVFSNVKKLQSTEDAFKIALGIMNYIYDDIDILAKGDSPDMDGDKLDGNGNSGEGQGKPMTKKEMQSKAAELLANGEYHEYYEMQNDIDATDWTQVRKEINVHDNQEMADEYPELSPQQAKQLVNALKKQTDFINDDIKKVGKLSKKDSQQVQSMEESGVTQKDAGEGLTQTDYQNDYKIIPSRTKVIYVKKITQQMIDDDLFPGLFGSYYYGGKTQESILTGIRLGTKLGKKLQIRGESRTLKNSRLDSGRIDKRLIAELGFNNSRVFQTTFVEQYSDAILHISVDASGSMHGDKWTNTMTSVVAICKAASMISNIDVVVSFRTTHYGGGSRSSSNQPLVAIGYDSRINTFQHIKKLWSNLKPGGTTPEGLCYEAIMDEFVPTSNNRDSYFLNFSDGMPMFSSSDFSYYNNEALQHTKRQVKKITDKGIGVMSYFVGDSGYDRANNMEDFKTMYGKNSEFIDLTNVVQIAKSMNKKFLEKNN